MSGCCVAYLLFPEAHLYHPYGLYCDPLGKLCGQWPNSTDFDGCLGWRLQPSIHYWAWGKLKQLSFWISWSLQVWKGLCGSLIVSAIYLVLIISLQVPFENTKLKFYFRFLGVKGDWPFLRSIYRLKTGFTSKRLCHICPAADSSLHTCMNAFVTTRTTTY